MPEVFPASHQEALRVGTSWLEGLLQDPRSRQPGLKSTGLGQVGVIVGEGREAWASRGWRSSPEGVSKAHYRALFPAHHRTMADGPPTAPRMTVLQPCGIQEKRSPRSGQEVVG